MCDSLFELYRGDDYSLRVVITDNQQNPIDLTGWSFKSSMKLSTELPDEDAPVKVNFGPVSGPDAEAGVVYISYPAEQTHELLPVPYFVDLQREYNGKITTIFVGKVVVKPDVTRRVGNE